MPDSNILPEMPQSYFVCTSDQAKISVLDEDGEEIQSAILLAAGQKIVIENLLSSADYKPRESVFIVISPSPKPR
jgi:hypothetical protein